MPAGSKLKLPDGQFVAYANTVGDRCTRHSSEWNNGEMTAGETVRDVRAAAWIPPEEAPRPENAVEIAGYVDKRSWKNGMYN